MTAPESTPLVTTVIPSCRRPQLTVRAVHSVLAQSFGNLEVIVVPACPGDGLPERIASINDSRLRTLEPKALGPSAARNRGVAAARGRWVAFLDDDDVWMPQKIKRQLAAATTSKQTAPVISCRMLARFASGEFVWPRRLPQPGEPIGDYLFRRRSLFGGGGFVQTSTIFASRELLIEIPFREDLHQAEDLDWVLRAERAGSRVEFAAPDEPLAVWDIQDDRPRQSRAGTWRASLDWIRSSPELVSRRAYASYLLTWVSADAARESASLSAWMELWREARRGGRPSLLDALVHVGHYLASPERLRQLASRVVGRRQGCRVG